VSPDKQLFPVLKNRDIVTTNYEGTFKSTLTEEQKREAHNKTEAYLRAGLTYEDCRKIQWSAGVQPLLEKETEHSLHSESQSPASKTTSGLTKGKFDAKKEKLASDKHTRSHNYDSKPAFKIQTEGVPITEFGAQGNQKQNCNSVIKDLDSKTEDCIPEEKPDAATSCVSLKRNMETIEIDDSSSGGSNAEEANVDKATTWCPPLTQPTTKVGRANNWCPPFTQQTSPESYFDDNGKCKLYRSKDKQTTLLQYSSFHSTKKNSGS